MDEARSADRFPEDGSGAWEHCQCTQQVARRRKIDARDASKLGQFVEGDSMSGGRAVPSRRREGQSTYVAGVLGEVLGPERVDPAPTVGVDDERDGEQNQQV